MVNTFLKAKHWQLFILLVGVPVVVQFILMFSMFYNIYDIENNPNSDTNPFQIFGIMSIFPIITLLFTGLYFGWFWSIANGLQELIPSDLSLNLKRFKLFFFIPLIYILFITLWMTNLYSGINETAFGDTQFFPWIFLILVPIHLFSMFCIFYLMYFVAKTIKTAELQRKVGFGDYAGEFFLLWFYFVGIWIVQPKVNKLAELRHNSQQRV